MKILKILLSVMLLVVIATSCTFAQKRELTDKTYDVQSFISVKSNTVAKVIYTQSDNVSARVEGDKEMVDKLKISVKDGVLEIHHDGKLRTINKKSVTIYISSPSIESIDADGVGNWSLKGKVIADNLKIGFEGVGNFEALELETNNIKARYEGVGNLKLGGTTNLLDISSEGVGSINTQKLLAKEAIVRSSGVGSVKCYASESIELRNDGVGSITYYGDPKVKSSNNSGIGKIRAGK